jgi:hypothetical protein
MKTKETSKKRGEMALRWISDLLTWSQIEHFLLGETAVLAKVDADMLVDKIEIGILKKNFGETTQRLFKTFLPDAELGDVIKFEKDGVPVEIKIISKHYAFFDHPDYVFYWADEYKIPNPFKKYWDTRFLIK